MIAYTSMEMRNDQHVVHAEGLHKRLVGPEGELIILDNVRLRVDRGQAVAIVGASGSGKSTLLGILAGLDTPTKGSVRLFGKELVQLNEDRRAELRMGRVGFVFQNFQLLFNLTALENVLLPMELQGVERDARSRAIEALERVGLAERANHYPRQLSGGEQQRVALARAFVIRPQILFADEPTGNLDEETGRRVGDLLFELRDEHAASLVLVTHDVALTRQCDRCFRLRGGSLEEA